MNVCFCLSCSEVVNSLQLLYAQSVERFHNGALSRTTDWFINAGQKSKKEKVLELWK